MQISSTVLRIIEHVLSGAEHKPADAALRGVLRGIDLEPEQKTLISRAVFTFYRWRGWLDEGRNLRTQLELAFDIAAQFAANEKSIPDEELLGRAVPLWARGAMKFPHELLREFQREPRLWIRARPGQARQLSAQLGDAQAHTAIPDAVWYRGLRDLFRTPEFHTGAFEIQDLSSQIVGHLAGLSPGQTWWDVCAGEGGKTLHLCDLMANKGLVWASDTAQWRLDSLKRRAGRAKVFNYRAKAWEDHAQLPTRTKFDGVLVDAPCSGLGTWGRNPHARWTTQAADVEKLSSLQQTILNRIAGSLKPGGKLVYSVCTLTAAETTRVVEAFEREHPEFERLLAAIPGSAESPRAQIVLEPQAWHASGMFVALWRRH